MELTEAVKELLVQTAKALKGSARRLLMARTVQALGEGGQRLAERELSWNRGTIRKGMHELERGIVCIDAFSSRGRKRSEEHLPTLLLDITALVDGQSQADPHFRTNRLYTRLTAHGLRNEMHLSSKMALDRSSLHSWVLRLQRNFYSVISKQAI